MSLMGAPMYCVTKSREARASQHKFASLSIRLATAETERAVLIAMPHSSEFDGYKFWHPRKLVRESRLKGKVSIGFTEEFVFYLRKYGSGLYNSREVTDEIPIAADEFEDVFAASANDYEPEEPLIYTPPRIDPENVTADESLIDYD